MKRRRQPFRHAVRWLIVTAIAAAHRYAQPGDLARIREAFDMTHGHRPPEWRGGIWAEGAERAARKKAIR